LSGWLSSPRISKLFAGKKAEELSERAEKAKRIAEEGVDLAKKYKV